MPEKPEALYGITGDDGGQSEKQLSKTLAERQPGSVRLDSVFGALADPRCRDVLRRLNTSRTPMALADVADAIVRRETERELTEVQVERERIYVSLYHRYVPKLIDANLVSFDVFEKRVPFRESDEVVIQEVLHER